MKVIYIVRHAKSSWDNPHLRDFDRPLNSRGARNIPDMGERLANQGIIPDIIFSSPANRALTTAKGIAAAVGFPADQIIEKAALYHAGPYEIKEVISEANDACDTLMIFGHNPGFTSLIEGLSDFSLYNLPTCAVCGIRLNMTSWKDIFSTEGTQFFYDYPKSRQD